MSKLALFALVLVAVFGVAYGAGAAIDPDARGRSDRELSLEVSRGAGSLALTVFEDGDPVTAFETEHERKMHVIVVREDLTGFQHLHPSMDAAGEWTAPLDLAAPGPYRVFADFDRGTLSGTVREPGAYVPEVLPEPADQAETDGYRVQLTRDGSETIFTVERDGEPVTDIQPYLGARGHLVALREGDLEYLHVHPTSPATPGRDVRFEVDYPSDGRYRLFLQFRHEGAVHTAAFTQDARATGGGEHGAGH